ncbi:hypothetical protein AAFF_G00107150 [Aldrovandia affinis]|uniref:Uncharacterized protein n=1 Tax=Aldrovandia affinis TaxID=143900 RepID=A0AAD7T346_9TELE|nr:hypothetical protein AAFF_G00107150 [Aldrovandia affinis]
MHGTALWTIRSAARPHLVRGPSIGLAFAPHGLMGSLRSKRRVRHHSSSPGRTPPATKREGGAVRSFLRLRNDIKVLTACWARGSKDCLRGQFHLDGEVGFDYSRRAEQNSFRHCSSTCQCRSGCGAGTDAVRYPASTLTVTERSGRVLRTLGSFVERDSSVGFERSALAPRSF